MVKPGRMTITETRLRLLSERLQEVPIGGTAGVSYHPRALIGHGGQGWVYRAGYDEPDGPSVGVKMLRPDVVNEEALTRFLREADVLRKLGQSQAPSPNVVRLFDHGVHRHTMPDGETYALPFMVLEFVDGPTLAQVLAEQPGQGFPAARVRRMFRQIARALSLIHAAQIVHRDLKPSNLILTSEAGGELTKLTDFGLVKRFDVDPGKGTMALAGASVGYAPPEQFETGNKRVSGRTDIFSFAAVLFEVLTGTAAFASLPSDTPFQILSRILSGPRPSLSTHGSPSPELAAQPAVMAAIDAALHHALRADPGERPDSILAFWETIEAQLRQVEGEPARSSPGAPLSGELAGTTRPSSGDSRPRPFSFTPQPPVAASTSAAPPPVSSGVPSDPDMHEPATGIHKPSSPPPVSEPTTTSNAVSSGVRASSLPASGPPVSSGPPVRVYTPVPSSGLPVPGSSPPVVAGASVMPGPSSSYAPGPPIPGGPPLSNYAPGASRPPPGSIATPPPTGGPIATPLPARQQGSFLLQTPAPGAAPDATGFSARPGAPLPERAWSMSLGPDGQMAYALGRFGLVRYHGEGWTHNLLPPSLSPLELRGVLVTPTGAPLVYGDRGALWGGGSDGSLVPWAPADPDLVWYSATLMMHPAEIVLVGELQSQRVPVIGLLRPGQALSSRRIDGCQRLQGAARLVSGVLLACGEGGELVTVGQGAAEAVTWGRTGHLTSVLPAPDGGAHVIGSGGHALYVTAGREARLEPVQTTRDLTAVTMGPMATPWAGGQEGRLLRRTRSGWAAFRRA